LAARGLDIPEIKFILHYQLPTREQEFTHRNGRTARMKSDGTAYILAWKNEELPDFIGKLRLKKSVPLPYLWLQSGKRFIFRADGATRYPKAILQVYS